MRNFRIMLDISAETEVAALSQAAEIAKIHNCIASLVSPDKSIRVDETGTIVGIVRRTLQNPQANANGTVDNVEDSASESLETE